MIEYPLQFLFDKYFVVSDTIQSSFIQPIFPLSNIRNNGYENYENDLNNNFNNFAHNKNGNINKKIFKLEDFLTDSKMKNSNNNIMNNDIY